MAHDTFGRVLMGSEDLLKSSFEVFSAMKVDQDLLDEDPAPLRTSQQTIATSVSVSGPGTFLGKEKRTITLMPSSRPGAQESDAAISSTSDHTASPPWRITCGTTGGSHACTAVS